MKPNRFRKTERNPKVRPLLLLLVLSLCLLFPRFSFGADLEVRFDEVTPLGGNGPQGRDFLPGDEIQVRVRLSVLQPTGNPFSLRLRIAGDGWRETLTSDSTGSDITYTGLRVPASAGEGKVSILMDAFSTQDTVALEGRRHAYLNVGCPPELPAGLADRFQVGTPIRDMALTADGRYLYVTRDVGLNPFSEEAKVTVIDVEMNEVVPTELEDSETIEFPTGVAPSPSGQEMYIADSSTSQVLHVVDAETHVLLETIELNPGGTLGATDLGDVAVSQVRNEAYVIDSSGPRILVVGLDPPHGVREIPLDENILEPPTGLLPIQVMVDSDPRFIYVLCRGLTEVIRMDVASGEILDFVQLGDLLDPPSLVSGLSMTLNTLTDQIYVVVNPNNFELAYPPTFGSKIIALSRDDLGNLAERDELLLAGSSIWELVVREDGRFVYAIDSYRGEILVIDMDSKTEMSRCAIPVEPGEASCGQTVSETACSWAGRWPGSSTSWSEPADPVNQGGSGSALHVGYRSDPAPRTLDDLTPDDPVDRPVRTLHQHIRPETLDHGNRGVLVERNHIVDALEARQDLCSILFRLHRTRRPLQSTNRVIAVDTHHQQIAHPPCLLEVANVPDVQEIETPVRENDAGALCPVRGEFLAEVFQGPELLAHLDTHSQGVGETCGLRDTDEFDPLVQHPAPGGVVRGHGFATSSSFRLKAVVRNAQIDQDIQDGIGPSFGYQVGLPGRQVIVEMGLDTESQVGVFLHDPCHLFEEGIGVGEGTLGVLIEEDRYENLDLVSREHRQSGDLVRAPILIHVIIVDFRIFQASVFPVRDPVSIHILTACEDLGPDSLRLLLAQANRILGCPEILFLKLLSGPGEVGLCGGERFRGTLRPLSALCLLQILLQPFHLLGQFLRIRVPSQDNRRQDDQKHQKCETTVDPQGTPLFSDPIVQGGAGWLIVWSLRALASCCSD